MTTDDYFYQELGVTDFIYCHDCRQYSDLYQYGDVESSGHANCKYRFVTEKELKNCVNDCIEFQCAKNQ